MSRQETINLMSDQVLRDLALAYERNPLVDNLTGRILELIKQDPHEAGTRPCETCRRITAMTGRPFWCLKKALDILSHIDKAVPMRDSDAL